MPVDVNPFRGGDRLSAGLTDGPGGVAGGEAERAGDLRAPARGREVPAHDGREASRDELSAALLAHGLYRRLGTQADLCTFMAHHVVCVWDFMSLVKSLQRDLGGWSMPWVPPRDRLAARFLNEIVLDEESDAIGDRFLSHFELYLEAMEEVGADTGPALRLIAAVRDGAEVCPAAREAGMPAAAVAFLDTSMDLLTRSLPARTAVFFYAREQAIPPMFTQFLTQIEGRGLRCPSLRAYLERHIECDGDRHGPMARALLEASLRDAGARASEDADDAARVALAARIALWDAVEAALD